MDMNPPLVNGSVSDNIRITRAIRNLGSHTSQGFGQVSLVPLSGLGTDVSHW